MSARVIKFPGRQRTPREQLESADIAGIHVAYVGGMWTLRRYLPSGGIVEMHGLTRTELANLVDTIARALQSIPL